MSADANAIPEKRSRSVLRMTGRPIAIDMPLVQVCLGARHVPRGMTLRHVARAYVSVAESPSAKLERLFWRSARWKASFI